MTTAREEISGIIDSAPGEPIDGGDGVIARIALALADRIDRLEASAPTSYSSEPQESE